MWSWVGSGRQVGCRGTCHGLNGCVCVCVTQVSSDCVVDSSCLV